jgi:hypothetical protein
VRDAAPVQESYREGNACNDFRDSIWTAQAALAITFRRETEVERSVSGKLPNDRV